LRELQLIQILSIKNFGRAVPRFVAKTAPALTGFCRCESSAARVQPGETGGWRAGKTGNWEEGDNRVLTLSHGRLKKGKAWARRGRSVSVDAGGEGKIGVNAR
jgi:hypothetical protein